MRNCIRNIFTYWHNPFGRKSLLGLPYEFTVENSTINFSAYKATTDPLVIKITYYTGIQYSNTLTFSSPTIGWNGWNSIHLDIGSTYLIELISGECAALSIDGVIVFDNR